MTFDLPMRRRQPRAWRWVVATIVAVVLSLVACAVLVVIGKAVFPSTVGYEHYAFADYGKLTIIGVVLGAWHGRPSRSSARGPSGRSSC